MTTVDDSSPESLCLEEDLCENIGFCREALQQQGRHYAYSNKYMFSRVQLCVCISHVIKCDYPGRWPDAAEKMALYIQSDNHAMWMGALMSVYQLVKVYE